MKHVQSEIWNKISNQTILWGDAQKEAKQYCEENAAGCPSVKIKSRLNLNI